MDKFTIIFSVKKMKFSREVKEVCDNVLVFPECLKESVSAAYMGKVKEIPKKELSYYGIHVYEEDGHILIEKSLLSNKESDVFIERVYIKIPYSHINYLNLEATVGFKKGVDRAAISSFTNKISKNEGDFNEFIEQKEFNFNESANNQYKFNINKVLKCFAEPNNLQSQYFNESEMFLGEDVSLNVFFRDELKRLMIVYESKDNQSIYEDEVLKITKIIFTRKLAVGQDSSKKYRINFAKIYYKLSGSNDYINIKYNKALSMNPKVDTEIYEIPINDHLGSVSVYFKENQYPPQIEGCTFSESFDNCGIGEVRCGKNFVEGRVILSSKYSNYLNMFLMEIVRKYKVKKEEVLNFLKELPDDISEQEMIDLIELNYVSDIKDVKKVIEEKKSMDYLYKKVWSVLQSDGETPEKIKAIEKTVREGNDADNGCL